MNRKFKTLVFIGILSLASLCPVLIFGQGGSSRPSTPAPSTTPSSPTSPGRQQTRPSDQNAGPIFVSGRILLESGQPLPESVSLELTCGMKPLQVIHTELGGYFTFNLGSGSQGNLDFSASNDNPLISSSASRDSSSRGGISSSLTGCEIRSSVPGYHPLSYTIRDITEMNRVEIGTLHLRRIAGSAGSAISTTSLLVPKEALKEYEKALKEIQNNKPESALPHLQKAVALYDKYAAAWNELGRIFLMSKDTDKARDAFAKAIADDGEYIPPYLNLATIQMQSRDYENAHKTATKLLELDSTIAFASFIQAVSAFNLQRVEEAEKSAREAERAAEGKLPQVHALLAQIFIQKQDYVRASAEMRSYLKESPTGPFADQMKKNLEEIQKSGEKKVDVVAQPDMPAASAPVADAPGPYTRGPYTRDSEEE